MALFIRVFASLFLLFSQFVYAVQEVDNIYFSRGDECSLTFQTFCTPEVYPKTTANEVVVPIDCDYYGYSDPQAHYSTQYRQGWTSPPEGSVLFGNSGLAQTRHKFCPVGSTISLDGCTATCVLKDPCMQKKDEQVELEELCGLSSCPAGASFSSTTKTCLKNGAIVPNQSVYSIPASGQIGEYV